MIIFLILVIQPWLIESVTYTGPMIDANISSLNNDLIAQEQIIQGIINDLIVNLDNATNMLITQNNTMVSSDQDGITSLYMSLRQLLVALNDVSSMSNFWSSQPLTTCESVNSKEIEVGFTLQYYRHISGRIQGVSSRLSEPALWATISAMTAQFTVGSKFSFGLDLISFIMTVTDAASSKLNTEYNNLMLMLDKAVNGESTVVTQVTTFMNQFCNCSNNITAAVARVVNYTKMVDSMEIPLVAAEKTVLNLAYNSFNLTLTAANTLSYPQEGKLLWISNYLTIANTYLDFLSSTSSFYNITWGSLTNCANLQTRVSQITLKYWQYTQAYFDLKSNITIGLTLQDEINTKLSETILNAAQTSATKALDNSVIKLQAAMNSYLNQLDTSTDSLFGIMSNLTVLSNNYCGCWTISPKTP